jgi:hypothetical protein
LISIELVSKPEKPILGFTVTDKCEHFEEACNPSTYSGGPFVLSWDFETTNKY